MEENKTKIKAGILAASSVQMSIVGVASTIPLMMAAFPTANPTLIQSVVTIPSLVNIPISLIVGASTAKIGKKNPLMLGLAILGIGGLLPAFLPASLSLLMFSVVLIGVGLGFIIPTSTGLIPEHFVGPAQGDMMGKQSAFVNLGGMILSLIGGFLAVIAWQNAFLIFVYPLIMMAIVLVCIPKEVKRTVAPGAAPPKMKFSTEVYIICLIGFLFALLFGVLNVNNALLVFERGLGDASTAGIAGSVMSGIGILVGITYGRIAVMLKKNIMPLALVIVAAGMTIMAFSTSAVMLCIGTAVCGVGFSCVMPTLIFRASMSVDPGSATFAISAVLATINLAMFASPIIINPITQMFAGTSVQARYLLGAAGLVLLACYAFVHTRKDPN